MNRRLTAGLLFWVGMCLAACSGEMSTREFVEAYHDGACRYVRECDADAECATEADWEDDVAWRCRFDEEYFAACLDEIDQEIAERDCEDITASIYAPSCVRAYDCGLNGGAALAR